MKMRVILIKKPDSNVSRKTIQSTPTLGYIHKPNYNNQLMNISYLIEY